MPILWYTRKWNRFRLAQVFQRKQFGPDNPAFEPDFMAGWKLRGHTSAATASPHRYGQQSMARKLQLLWLPGITGSHRQVWFPGITG
jgi:hypothetical protein